MEQNASNGLITKTLGAATQPSRLKEANAHLNRQITDLQDVVDSLFAMFDPVLKPEKPRDDGSMVAPAKQLSSEQVSFLDDQADRIIGIRNRLLCLKDRSEV